MGLKKFVQHSKNKKYDEWTSMCIKLNSCESLL